MLVSTPRRLGSGRCCTPRNQARMQAAAPVAAPAAGRGRRQGGDGALLACACRLEIPSGGHLLPPSAAYARLQAMGPTESRGSGLARMARHGTLRLRAISHPDFRVAALGPWGARGAAPMGTGWPWQAHAGRTAGPAAALRHPPPHCTCPHAAAISP